MPKQPHSALLNEIIYNKIIMRFLYFYEIFTICLVISLVMVTMSGHSIPSFQPPINQVAKASTYPMRTFAYIGSNALLQSNMPPDWLLDQLGITDVIVYWDDSQMLYQTTTTQQMVTSKLTLIRQKLGNRINFWPAWWSFNTIGWTGSPQTSPDFNLAGRWNNDSNWQIHYRNLGYLSNALALTNASGVFLDLENYGDTPNSNGGFMQGLAWTNDPLVSTRAQGWWTALTSNWHGQPGFYIHWADAVRWPALITWSKTIYGLAGGGVFNFEDSFTATINNSNYDTVAQSIKSTLGQSVEAYPGIWLTQSNAGTLGSQLSRALTLTNGFWLYDNAGTALYDPVSLSGLKNSLSGLISPPSPTPSTMPSSSPVISPSPPASPSIAIQKSVDKTQAQTGASLTYTITVTNNGSALATYVTVSDPLPMGVTYVNGSAMPATQVVFNPTNRTMQWRLGSLAPNSNSILSFQTVIN